MTEYVYQGRQNPIGFVLKENSVALNSTQMALITEVEIQYKGSYYSSASYASVFDWASYATQGKVLAYLGTIGLPVGRDYEAELIIYASGYPDGIVWDTIDLVVIDEDQDDPDIVVEDGSASQASANSYISLDYFTTYCTNRGYSLTNPTPSSRKQAIMRAMTYIETRPWKGVKTVQGNPCEWPRDGVLDRDGYIVDVGTVPTNILKAQAEAAYQEHEELGLFDLIQSRDSTVKKKKVGQLETEYFEAQATKIPPVIKRLIYGYITGTGTIELVRC